jgi:aryl-alcohol dehydrogenase-like predicted oxidoreductase
MKYVNLGDQKVSAIGLGLWQFGTRRWREGRQFDAAAATEIVQRALGLGINFFDTAEIYGHGRSERLFAEALAGRRAEAVIATKVAPNHATRKGVVEAADRSLARLDTGVIDLYQMHWPNRFIPVSRTMAGMRDLVAAGKVRQVGVSNYPLSLWRAAERHLGAPVISNQVLFHLLDRRSLDDLVPYAQEKGRFVIAYSPLAQGALGGHYGRDELPPDARGSQPRFVGEAYDRLDPLREALASIAKTYEATTAQVALAWLIHIPNVIAIPGTRDVAHLEQDAAAAEIDLSDEEWQRLTDAAQLVAPRPKHRRLTGIASWLLGAR